MSFSTAIALRYLKSSRENRFFSWISILSIIGIAIGVASMIVVLSVINGFETEMRDRFLSANAHILAYNFPTGLRSPEVWEKKFTADFKKDITGVSPFIHGETMLRKDSILHATLVRGISPQKREKVQSLSEVIKPQNSLKILQKELLTPNTTTPGVILGIRLLKIMQANVGDIVELISPSEENPVGNFQKFKVVGIYDSGLAHYDSKISIMSIPAAQALFGMEQDVVTGLEIGLKHPDDSTPIAAQMRSKYNMSIKKWQDFNRNVFDAMRTQKMVIGLIVWLVALVASFNILTTLFVSVNQKQRDISLFKALGANNEQILSLFLKQGLLIGFIGTSLGVIIALGLSFLIDHYKFIKMPDVYPLATLPVEYNFSVYAGISLASIFLCTIAGLYPAWSATRVSPTEGISGGRAGG